MSHPTSQSLRNTRIVDSSSCSIPILQSKIKYKVRYSKPLLRDNIYLEKLRLQRVGTESTV